MPQSIPAGLTQEHVLRATTIHSAKSDEVVDEEPVTHKDWSEQEVRLIFADYFAMLEAELGGVSAFEM
jgi:hypothetical protein